MKLRKLFFMLVLALTLFIGLTACQQKDDDKDPDQPTNTFEPVAIETIATTYSNNQAVQAEGIVYGVTENGFYLSDSAEGHLFVVIGDGFKKDVAVGDKVQVTGKFSYAKNLIQINAVSKYEKVGTGTAPVVAYESTVPAVNSLSNSDKKSFGKVVTLTGTISLDATNMYALTDLDGNKIFFDNNSNLEALAQYANKRVILNAVVYKYLTSDAVWTLSYVGSSNDIVESPLTFEYVKEKAIAHLNESVAKNVYGALTLPTVHNVLSNVTYSWAVEANDYLTIVDNIPTVVIDSVDHDLVLKVTITYDNQSETLDFPITLKGIVEQTVSEFYANKPVVDDSKVIIRGIVTSFARNQSLSLRSIIVKDPVTNETVPVDFSSSGDYILNDSETFKSIKIGDEIVITAEYSFSGRPTIQRVSTVEIKSNNNPVSHDFENAYVLDSQAAYENLAANVYDYSGQLVKFANPFLNYSTSSTPADTNWVQLGYNDKIGAEGFKVNGTARKFAFLIAAINENLGSSLWHTNYEIPFVTGPAAQFNLEIYAYCLYVSDSYVAFIVPDESAYKVAPQDQIIMDLGNAIPSSVEMENVTLITEHELVTGAITWSSSHPQIIDPTTGVVSEVSENTVVTLTATYEFEGETKEFVKEITVLASHAISVSELLSTALDGYKYKVNGVVVGFSSDGNSVESRKGIIIMDPETKELLLVDGIGTLYGVEYPNYVDVNGTQITIGTNVTVTGNYGLNTPEIGSGPTQTGRVHLDVSSNGKVEALDIVELTFDDEKALIVDSHDAQNLLVSEGVPFGKLIKFVGTSENPIYFGGSSNTAPINYKVFMNNAVDNDGTKYNGKTFAFKANNNVPNAGENWFSKYLALPETFVCPNSTNPSRAVVGTVYAVITHVTSTYYQMAIVNIENWDVQPEVQYVKEAVVEGLVSSTESGAFNIQLPTETYLTGAITWTSTSDLINLETGVVANVTESAEVTLVGTFTYAGETHTVEHIVTILAGAAKSISEIKTLEEGVTVFGKGIFIGYAGNGTWSEIIVKDENSMSFIGIKTTDSYTKGDLIQFTATIAISTNETEAGKKYLVDPTSVEVVSSGNSTELDLTQAISITTQEELSKIHEGEEYVLYKFEGNMFGNMYESKKDYSKAYFRLNFNAEATTLSDIRFTNEAGSNISAGFRNSYIAKNLGDNWATDVFGTTEYSAGGYPGHAFSGVIYAMYVGGNGYYEQFTIFETSHIIKAEN